MQNISSNKMNSHLGEITNLKKKFIKNYKNNDSVAIDTIKKMRITHGCAIYDDFLEKVNLMKMGDDNATDNDWIKISTHSTILSVMQTHIKYCEKLAYNHKNTLNQNNLDFNNNNEKSVFNSSKNNLYATLNKKATGTDELSIKNFNTETENQSDLFTETKNNNNLKNQSNQLNTSDYINNLKTDQSSDLFFDNKSGGYDNTESLIKGYVDADINLDINKPTLVNYWADWCSFSNSFHKEWEKFMKQYKKKYNNLQVLDLNIGTDKKLGKAVSDAGVNRFPTLVLYNNKKVFTKVAGNMKAENVDEFVEKSLAS